MKNTKGLTLIEMMITITIIALLMVITVPVVMNSLDDVHHKDLISEAHAILKMAESQSHRDSLAGISNTDQNQEQVMIHDATRLQHIVDKAQGHGEIIELGFLYGKVNILTYRIHNQSLIYDNERDDFKIKEE